MTMIGLALMILGGVMLAYTGFTWTTQETVVDLGPLKATADKKHSVAFSPLVGLVALVGGVVLVVGGRRGS
jgi:hypothetical protein